jgi:hypothetical protein
MTWLVSMRFGFLVLMALFVLLVIWLGERDA